VRHLHPAQVQTALALLYGEFHPICIKLSRLDHPPWLALGTTLPGRSTRLPPLLTGFSLPFLFAL
jgi:hypothetical protein